MQTKASVQVELAQGRVSGQSNYYPLLLFFEVQEYSFLSAPAQLYSRNPRKVDIVLPNLLFANLQLGVRAYSPDPAICISTYLKRHMAMKESTH
jgi:hypothetical protein